MTDKIDVEIGSPEQKFWSDVCKKALEDILNNKRMREINEQIFNFAEKRVEEEKKIMESK